ncbi:MAG TPA: hypothetical protein VGG33_24285 [Polyangia bacterium]
MGGDAKDCQLERGPTSGKMDPLLRETLKSEARKRSVFVSLTIRDSNGIAPQKCVIARIIEIGGEVTETYRSNVTLAKLTASQAEDIAAFIVVSQIEDAERIGPID